MGDKHYLDVPYVEKDEAKRRGAIWDPIEQRWYAPEGADLEGPSRWDPEVKAKNSPYIYLVFARRECFRCHKVTPVVAIGVPYCSETLLAGCARADSVMLVPRVECLPAEIREYLEANSGYRKAHSKTKQETALMNTCIHCETLQGDFFLYYEDDSVFLIDNAEKIKGLTFVKVPIAQLWGMVYPESTADDLLFQYAAANHETVDLGVVETVITATPDISELLDERAIEEEGQSGKESYPCEVIMSDAGRVDEVRLSTRSKEGLIVNNERVRPFFDYLRKLVDIWCPKRTH